MLLGWYKSDFGFTLLKYFIRYWNTFLNKCGLFYISLMHISSFMFLLMNHCLLFNLYIF